LAHPVCGSVGLGTSQEEGYSQNKYDWW